MKDITKPPTGEIYSSSTGVYTSSTSMQTAARLKVISYLRIPYSQVVAHTSSIWDSGNWVRKKWRSTIRSTAKQNLVPLYQKICKKAFPYNTQYSQPLHWYRVLLDTGLPQYHIHTYLSYIMTLPKTSWPHRSALKGIMTYLMTCLYKTLWPHSPALISTKRPPD